MHRAGQATIGVLETVTAIIKILGGIRIWKSGSCRVPAELSDITQDAAARFRVEDKAGVLVTNVNRGSLAWEAGFRPGDVILEVNRNPVENLEDYDEIVSDLEPGKQYLFLLVKKTHEHDLHRLRSQEINGN